MSAGVRLGKAILYASGFTLGIYLCARYWFGDANDFGFYFAVFGAYMMGWFGGSRRVDDVIHVEPRE